jgi:hypothetical protein
MGLQSSQAHIIGREGRFYIEPEVTPGTFVKATTGGSFNAFKFDMTPNINRKDRVDAYMATRDVLERITGKSEYSWSMEGPWIPSGTKNTAPDVGQFVKAALGSEAVNANDVTYATNSAQTLLTLSGTRHYQSLFMESMWGMWVEEAKWAFAGGNEPMFSCSGGAMGYVQTSYGTLDGAVVGSNNIIVQDTDEWMMGVNSVLTIDDQDDRQVTAVVDRANQTFTVDGAALNEDDDDPVVPYAPTHTDVGSPCSGISGSLVLGALSPAVVTGAEVVLKNNIKALDDIAFAQDVADAIPNLRDVSGNVSFRMRQDHLIYVLNRQEFATVSLTITAGGAAQSGTRLQILVPQAELEFSAVEVPETEEATITVPFRGLGSSGNDAIAVIHT